MEETRTFLTLSGTVFALSLVIIAVVKGRKRRFQNWRELSSKKLEDGSYCSRIGEIVKLELGFWQRSFVMLDSYGQLTIR